MKKIVVDMQNFLFADSIATAFKNSDYDIAVVRAESPRDTIELCRVFKPFVLLMEVTAYTPWLLCERMKLRDEAKTVCPDCKIALIVDEPKRLARLDGITKVSLLAKYGMTEADAYKLCQEHGLLSPIYAHCRRNGCWFCPNASDSELLHMVTKHPDIA